MFPLAASLAWGSVAGSALQFVVQLPSVLSAACAGSGSAGRAVRGRAHGGPQLRSGLRQPRRGADQRLRGRPAGQPPAHRRAGGLAYAQTLYILPVSLFGMSVSAAELPAMSSAAGADARCTRTCGAGWTPACGRSPSSSCRRRWRSWPSAMWWRGPSTRRAGSPAADSLFVWAILAGSAVGLLATTLGRLYASAFYALQDTRTPLRFAWSSAFSWPQGWVSWPPFRCPRASGLPPAGASRV